MKKPRFSVKTLVWVLTLAAVFLAWWADHKKLSDRIEYLENRPVLYWNQIEWGPIRAADY